MDRLSQAIKDAKRYEKKIAILYLEVEYFKQINNASGFDISNEVLQNIAQQLLDCVEASDTIARIEGGEFVVILDNCDDATHLQSIIKNIMELPKKKLFIRHHQVSFQLYLGIAMYPEHSIDDLTLFSHAHTAMSLVKETRISGYKYYSIQLSEQAFHNEKLEYELVESINNEQLEVYYQLQFDGRDESVVGIEAYVRWRHPTMGVISPELFIRLSEETGFVVEIDKWIMKEAMAQFQKWYKAGLNPGVLTLNLSELRLGEDSFTEEIKKIVEASECIRENLCFEVTESEVMHNPEASIEKLHQLSSLGVQFSLDNFGVDVSALTYLKKLPVNRLIIDNSFVSNLEENEDDRNIIKSIIAIAENMSIDVVAQGVETQAQADFLVENSCFNLQGYLYHKASLAEDVEKRLQKLSLKN